MVENGAIANGNGRVAAIKMAYSGGTKRYGIVAYHNRR